jgi:MFS transporter, OFA family, oxalate/formate antiporter
MLFANSTAQFSIGVMFKPIIEDFGWTRGFISGVVMINMAVFAFAMSIMGKAYDRFGPKWIIIVSASFLAVGFVGMSRMTSVFEFILYYGIVCGIGFSGSTSLVFSSLISKWFAKWRGFAIGLALSGGRLGQFFLIPIYTTWVIHYGWQTTYLLIGLIILAVNYLLTFMVVKGDPLQLGYRSFGERPASPVPAADNGAVPLLSKALDFNLREAFRSVSFWLYVLVMFVCGAGDFLVTTHLIPFVTDQGISAVTAGHMLAWLGLMSLVGVLVAGPAADLIGNKIPIVITFLMRVALFLMVIHYHNEVSFYVFSLGFGFTMMITAVLTVTLVGKMYGFLYIGTLTGFITTIHHFAGGLLAYAGGVVYDLTDSYQTVFWVYTVMSLIAVAATLLIREERHQKASKI